MVLEKLKDMAEKYTEKPITKAVITVPAYFNDAQRNSTVAAGRIAGLDVLRILNEPTAAAMAYGLDRMTNGSSNVLIIDLGGGTFDVSLLTIDNGTFEVLAVGGDTHLGGEDFDNILVNYCIDDFNLKTGIDLRNNKKIIQRLKSICERVKCLLSKRDSEEIDVSSLCED